MADEQTEGTGQGSPEPVEVAFERAFGAAEAAPADTGTETPPTEDRTEATTAPEQPGDAEDPARGEPPEEPEDPDADKPLTKRSWVVQRKEFEERLKAAEERFAKADAGKQQAEQQLTEAENDVKRFLGIDTDASGQTAYERVKAQLYQGYTGAATTLEQYDQNRGFFPKLVQLATLSAQQQWSEGYYSAEKELGLSHEKLAKAPTPLDALRHAVEVGEARRQPEIDKLKSRLESVEVDLAAAKSSLGAASNGPISGGRSSDGLPAFDWSADPLKNFDAVFGQPPETARK